MATGRFASETTVSPQRSRAEIENILVRYGACSFVFAQQPGRSAIAFELGGRKIRFIILEPPVERFKQTESGRSRSGEAADLAHAKEIRRMWRALVLVIKAKMEAVESGIVTIESEFMAHIVLPDGRTVAEEVLPRIASAYEGRSVPLLPRYE
jgi:hypothetical protein